MYRSYQSRINSTASDVALYNLLEEYLLALKDNHGWLEADDALYAKMDSLQTEAEEPDEGGKEYGDFGIADIVTEAWLDTELYRG